MRTCREVHHAVDVVLGQYSRHSRPVQQVTLHKVKIGQGLETVDVGRRGNLVKLVKTDNAVFGILDC